jgi:hypothetical protein
MHAFMLQLANSKIDAGIDVLVCPCGSVLDHKSCSKRLGNCKSPECRTFMPSLKTAQCGKWCACPSLREKQSSPSATHFPECQKSGTRGSQSSPSVALGEELHSGKVAFPECLNGHATREIPTLGEGHLPRAQHSGKTGTRKRKVAFDDNIRQSRLQKKLKKNSSLSA